VSSSLTAVDEAVQRTRERTRLPRRSLAEAWGGHRRLVKSGCDSRATPTASAGAPDAPIGYDDSPRHPDEHCSKRPVLSARVHLIAPLGAHAEWRQDRRQVNNDSALTGACGGTSRAIEVFIGLPSPAPPRSLWRPAPPSPADVSRLRPRRYGLSSSPSIPTSTARRTRSSSQSISSSAKARLSG
jgi:hypothetical protein